MRSIFQQEVAFAEAILDQVVLVSVESFDRQLQVANTAMDQLGAATAGPFREIILFDQSHFQTAGRRIEGDATTGCATTDDEQVEELAGF